MAGRSRPSAEKRRIDKLRQEQQAAKRERRQARGEGRDDDAPEGPSQDELLERFRLLSEAHAAGKVTEEDFGPARHELMVALGMAEPDEDDEPDED